jgi:hypothetical protein
MSRTLNVKNERLSMEDLEMVASKSPIVIDAAQTGVDGVAASVVEI